MPNLSVTGNTNICNGETTIVSASGANSYSWSTKSSGSAISINPSVTTTYSVTGYNAISGCSSSQIFTVVVTDCTTIFDEIVSNDLAFSIYPNPSNNYLLVENKIELRILLSDQQGRILFDAVLEPGRNTIDLSDRDNCVYFLKCITKNGTINKRIVKIGE
jgi:hypothetical protein